MKINSSIGMRVALFLLLIGFMRINQAMADSWTQTDWSGGSGQAIWLDATKYQSDDGHVDVTSSPGDVKLSETCAVLEPSFETINNWTYEETDGAFNGNQSTDWQTDRTYSYKFWSTSDPHKGYCQIYQSLDFKDIDTIYFDAKLWANNTEEFQAYVFVDNDTLWMQYCPTTATEYLNQSVDVSSYTGNHNLIFRITNMKGRQAQTNYFDNIRTAPCEYYSSANLVSSVYDVGSSSSKWGTMTWNDAGVQTVNLKVRTSNDPNMTGATDWSICNYVTKNQDISSINSVTDGQRYIQYRTEISTADSSQTPTLNDVTINYESSEITVTSTSIAPYKVIQGTGNVGVEKLSLVTSGYDVIWSAVKVKNRVSTGTVAASDIDLIKIYKESGITSDFQVSEDTLIGNALLTDDGLGGYANIDITDQTITTISQDYYIVYDIALGADLVNSFGAKLDSASYIILTGMGAVSEVEFPIQSYAHQITRTFDIDWACFHHDSTRTGLSNLTGDMDSVTLLWSYTTGNEVHSSPAIGDIDNDGDVEIVIGSRDKKIYALSGANGDTLWTYLTGGEILRSSPTLGDIDNDDNLEVVVGAKDKKVYALNAEDGSFLWSYTTGGEIHSSPVLGDIDHDSKLEVIIGSRDGRDGKVYALNGEDGSFLWSYTTGNEIWSSPALADIDNDDTLEVLIGSRDKKVYALNGEDGSFLWSYTTGGEIWYSSPAIGNLDSDDSLEVVIGTRDKKVYALNGEDGSFLWSYTTGGEIHSSPALGDIDNDSKLEVVVGSKNDDKVYALNGEDGSFLWSYTTGNEVHSSPALGDINGDNKLEVIVGSKDKKIYALKGEDGSLLWFYITGGEIWSSPALGDIDDDNYIEVVVGAKNDHKVYALDGYPLRPNIAVSPDSFAITLCKDESKDTTLVIFNTGNTPLIWSLTENPSVDWLSEDTTNGSTNPSAEDSVSLHFDATSLSPGTYNDTLVITSNDPDESTVKVPIQLTVNAADISVSPNNFDLTIYVDSTKDTTLVISNVGNCDLIWSLLENSSVDWLSESPTSGSVSPSAQDSVTVQFDATSLSPGTYNDTLVITSNDPDEFIIKIPVRLTVVAPDIALSDSSHNYGDVVVGDSLDWIFKIYNEGTTNLTVDSIKSTTAEFEITSPAFPDTILPSDSLSVTVTFIPSGAGAVAGTLVVYSDDPDESTVSVFLSGNGVISTYSISGYVKYYSDSTPVKNVKMVISGGVSDTTFTDSTGYYIFSSLQSGLDYTVTPVKTDTSKDTTITSYDASLVLNHTVDLDTLDENQQKASDVSGNGTVSPYDAGLILRYVVDKIVHFPAGDWTFTPDSINYISLSSNQSNQNYTAILYGDTSGSGPGSKRGALRTRLFQGGAFEKQKQKRGGVR